MMDDQNDTELQFLEWSVILLATVMLLDYIEKKLKPLTGRSAHIQ